MGPLKSTEIGDLMEKVQVSTLKERTPENRRDQIERLQTTCTGRKILSSSIDHRFNYRVQEHPQKHGLEPAKRTTIHKEKAFRGDQGHPKSRQQGVDKCCSQQQRSDGSLA